MITQNGARDIVKNLDLRAVAKLIIHVVIDAASGPHRIARLLEMAGCSDPFSVALLLEGLSSEHSRGALSYGSFYASMRFLTARDYALRNETGSEALTMIREGIRVL